MTLRHVIDFYMDGHIAVSFCKVCSKEGQELLQECTGPIDMPNFFQGMTKREFEEKYSKALDEKKRSG